MNSLFIIGIVRRLLTQTDKQTNQLTNERTHNRANRTDTERIGLYFIKTKKKEPKLRKHKKKCHQVRDIE